MKELDKVFSLMERIDGQYREYKRNLNEELLLEKDTKLKQLDKIIDRVFSRYFVIDGPVRSSEYYVNDNPYTTWREYLVKNFRETFNLTQNSDMKYIPVVARLAYSNEVRFDITNDNEDEIGMLERLTALFKKDDALFQEVKDDESITFNQLVRRFGTQFDEEDALDDEAANNFDITGETKYTIVELPDYDAAHRLLNYTCSSSPMCYCKSRSVWNDYSHDGAYRAFVCLRDGWEDVPAEPSAGNPYDYYGTSMIFVFLTPKNKIATSNCRWNHTHVGPYISGNVNKAFTKEKLAKTLGIHFNDAFGIEPMGY